MVLCFNLFAGPHHGKLEDNALNMGREKRKVRPSTGAAGSREKRRRTQKVLFDPLAPAPEGLVARPPIPKLKHHIYYEFVQNEYKQDKVLEIQVEMSEKLAPPTSRA